MARVNNIAVGMIGSTARAALWLALGAVTLGAAVATRQAFSQEPPAADAAPLSADALADLVGRIALYPDDLVGIVLPASTYPLQVVQAARFLESRAKNPSLKPDADWDDSVVALLNYPEVVKVMNDDLDWTWRLGDAVISQRAGVLDAIQGFRDRAYAAGNLRSDDRQVVENDDDGAIAIKPADPEVIYVPYYEPERVVVYQTVPVYHYYPYAYPVYYYPYPVGYAFNTGFFWGVSSAFMIGWHSHFLEVRHHGYWGHPYYGRTYYDPFYVRRDANVSVSHGRYVWEPHYRLGAQPFTRSDGRRFTGTRDSTRDGDSRDSAFRGSYRNGNGAVSRSDGQQRNSPIDPRAVVSRDRAAPGTTPDAAPAANPRVPGVNPRPGENGGTYRSGVASRTGSALSRAGSAVPRRDADAAAGGDTPTGGVSGSAPNDRQASPSPPNLSQRGREAALPRYRLAPPASGAVRAPDDGAARTEAPSARTPGQYRYGSGTSQALRQEAAPPVRIAPPQAERGAGQARISGGAGNGGVYRPERAAPPRVESANPAGSARTDSSRGDGGGRSEPAPAYRGGSARPESAYRGGGDGGRASGAGRSRSSER